MATETREWTWYVLTEDPADYRAVLEDILALVDYADSEVSLRRGIRHILRFNVWIHPTQIDVDMRQCWPTFDQHADDDWEMAYTNAIHAIIEKL